MSEIKDQIKALNEDYQKALKMNDNASYSQLSINIADAEANIREYIQGITKNEIQTIVNKLRNNEQLTKFEIDYIRLWLVSDAEHYIQAENDFENWQNESKRLMDQINALQNSDLNFVEASKLRALLLDLTRTASDINFYLQQKERVEKFNESTKELDSEESELLINLLTSKMKSPNF